MLQAIVGTVLILLQIGDGTGADLTCFPRNSTTGPPYLSNWPTKMCAPWKCRDVSGGRRRSLHYITVTNV